MRAFAVLGFLFGFGMVLVMPMVILEALLDTGGVTTAPALSPGEIQFAAGIMGIGILLAGFSAILWLLTETREVHR